MQNDFQYIVDFSNLDELAGKTVLITGATGLIGKTLVKSLLYFNEENLKIINIVACVRNLKKAEKLFGKEASYLHYLVADICQLKPENLGVNAIIHAASQTSSKSFVTAPVETIDVAITGTKNILEFARVNPVESFVYLSSMEVYGTPQTDEKIIETHGTDLNTMQVRTCYPESKRMCENLCVAYGSEYQFPVKIVRLTQTFGPGVDYHDGRVFAQFARCRIEHRDIVLNTAGKTKRSYLYTADAATAIFMVLLKGKNGEAYNAANESSYCSIYEMAQMVATLDEDSSIKVVVKEADPKNFGYAPTLHMNLSTEKLKKLGWNPRVDLKTAYRNLIESMKLDECGRLMRKQEN